jgi:hypothetical protein
VIDSSPIAALVRNMAENGFEGSASELLAVLNEGAEDAITRLKAWPKSPSALSGALRRLAPNLREIDVEIDFEREGKDRRRVIRVRKSAEKERPPRPPRPPGTDEPPSADGADGADGDLHTYHPEHNGSAPSDEEMAKQLGISLYDEEARR